jgi:hypothetical protein
VLLVQPVEIDVRVAHEDIQEVVRRVAVLGQLVLGVNRRDVLVEVARLGAYRSKID